MAGRTPNLAAVLPGGAWEGRHTPGSFTYAAHHAFFAGFLPTPVTPGRHPRLFAAISRQRDDRPGDLGFRRTRHGLRAGRRGYHPVCVGGVGFFNRLSPLGWCCPGCSPRATGSRNWASPTPIDRSQLTLVEPVLDRAPTDRPLFLFLKVSALHQPNRHYLPGAAHDSKESHAAALEYVDRHIGRLFTGLPAGRGRPCFTILCSDHGTAYGEDGYEGHRLAHPVVWTVPYAEFVLPEMPR